MGWLYLIITYLLYLFGVGLILLVVYLVVMFVDCLFNFLGLLLMCVDGWFCLLLFKFGCCLLTGLTLRGFLGTGCIVWWLLVCLMVALRDLLDSSEFWFINSVVVWIVVLVVDYAFRLKIVDCVLLVAFVWFGWFVIVLIWICWVLFGVCFVVLCL